MLSYTKKAEKNTKILKKLPSHIPKILKKIHFWATPPVIYYMLLNIIPLSLTMTSHLIIEGNNNDRLYGNRVVLFEEILMPGFWLSISCPDNKRKYSHNTDSAGLYCQDL